MTHGCLSRRVATAFALALAGPALAGCANEGPLMARRTTLGSLKASVSHLELENAKLRTDLAGIKDQKRELEDRLVQEESLNGDLAARLDDARYQLGQVGVVPSDPRRSVGADPLDAPSTRPVGRPKRKPPVARIPGRVETIEPDDADGREGWSQPRSRPAVPPDAQSRRRADEDSTWLPVARSTAPSGVRMVR